MHIKLYKKNPKMKSYIETLKWRYATKQFDASKSISNEKIEELKEALQLSASSFGLQAYKFVLIENKELQKELRKASWDQSQVEDASHVFVLCAQKETSATDVDTYLENISKNRGVAVADLSGYGDFMKNYIKGQDAQSNTVWTAKQVYIAAGNLLSACAALEIDSCPMEGFDAAAFDKTLGLEEKGLTSAMVIPVGYRSAADDTQNYPKVRKSMDDLFLNF